MSARAPAGGRGLGEGKIHEAPSPLILSLQRLTFTHKSGLDTGVWAQVCKFLKKR